MTRRRRAAIRILSHVKWLEQVNVCWPASNSPPLPVLAHAGALVVRK